MPVTKLTRMLLPNRRYAFYLCILSALTSTSWLGTRHGGAVIASSASMSSHQNSANGMRPARVSNGKGAPPVTRTYYIAADEVDWDYAPSGTNLAEGRPFDDEEKKFMEAGPTVIGRRVKKALYREYTDDTFKTLKPRPPEWEHLGFLGPLIRAQVGDTIRVVFKNNVKFRATMHPHGVSYKKDSEGAIYNDGSSGADKADDGVPPGGTYTYV